MILTIKIEKTNPELPGRNYISVYDDEGNRLITSDQERIIADYTYMCDDLIYDNGYIKAMFYLFNNVQIRYVQKACDAFLRTYDTSIKRYNKILSSPNYKETHEDILLLNLWNKYGPK